MCGIVGYVGKRPAVSLLIEGLKLLEYRGYDSTGVAVLSQGKYAIYKREGRLSEVEKVVAHAPTTHTQSTVGMGHTRWATHGKPTTQNAHPHQAGHVVLVHNGIIENYREIKSDLISKGIKPVTETDSELFGYLVLEAMDGGKNLHQAVRESFSKIRGNCSIVVSSEKEPDVIIGVRQGSPLVAAVDPQGGGILASDVQPLLAYTKDVYFLEHGEMVELRTTGLQFYELESDQKIQKKPVQIDWSLEQMTKNGYAHFMLKEIEEQPTAWIDTLNTLVDRGVDRSFALADQKVEKLLQTAKKIVLVACGSSWHAALVAKYWIEDIAGIAVEVDLGSEYRYRKKVVTPGTVMIGITQSGETADTLACIREARSLEIATVALTNCRGSSITREAEFSLFLGAGPEISVATTKAFTCQLLVFWVLAYAMSQSLSAQDKQKAYEQLILLPHLAKDFLLAKHTWSEDLDLAVEIAKKSRGVFFVGRGIHFPIALEGALKLKEIAYLHAEGYPAGELKHGPIAMLDERMLVVVLSPKDRWYEKSLSNTEEARARKARVFAIGSFGDQILKDVSDVALGLPSELEGKVPDFSIFLESLLVQLLSYRIALALGHDIDKPRNLAKSVTVE